MFNYLLFFQSGYFKQQRATLRGNPYLCLCDPVRVMIQGATIPVYFPLRCAPFLRNRERQKIRPRVGRCVLYSTTEENGGITAE